MTTIIEDVPVESTAVGALTPSLGSWMFNIRVERLAASTTSWVVQGTLHIAGRPSAPYALRGEDYPELVALWDNDDDAIYDSI